MEGLIQETRYIVNHYADKAIKKSITFREALKLVNVYSEQSELGVAIKKAIQNEITQRALDSKCNITVPPIE